MHQLFTKTLRTETHSLSIKEIEGRCIDFISKQFTADSAHDLSHVKRVVENAKLLLRNESADPEIVIAATCLHDCIVLPKDHPKRSIASKLAAEKAVQFLRTQPFPEKKLPDVAHAIIAHSYSAGITPKTTEAKIVQDADRLDALGAIGIARCFTVGGKLDRILYSADDPFCRNRKPDEKTYSVDHFFSKLFELPTTMHTESAKLEAKRRVHFMKQFLIQFQQEIDSSFQLKL